MSERVPDGWSLQLLEDISKSSAGGTPSTQVREYWDNGEVPWLSSGEVHKKRIYQVDQHITQAGLENSSAKLFPPKTILVALAGQGKTRGTVAISEMELTTNQSVAGVFVNQKKAIPDFVFFNLESRYQELRNVSGGSGRAGLNLRIISDLLICLPPKPEQRKIASILTSVDEVIETTEAQISKLQDLKKGMMQELLTKGIGHTEFKDSPVGKIPKEWNRVHLESVCSLITKGATPTTYGHAYVENGVKFYRSINASIDGSLLLADLKYITDDADLSQKRSRLSVGDVIISIVGAKTGRTFFTVTQSSELPANINQNIALIRPHKETLNSGFLKYAIAFDDFQYQVDMEITTQAQPSLSLKQVGDFEITLPSIQEQVKFSDRLDSVDRLMHAGTGKLNSLCKIKTALMQDILTGKVRVKVN